MKKVISLIIFCALSMAAYATPSTQIWNPSTDLQAVGTYHLGIDNYFTTQGPADGGYAFPSDLGLTYGVFSGLEVGVDIMLPQANPLVFNAKYAIPESSVLPVSIGVGIFGLGTAKDITDQNVAYMLVAKNFDLFGRLSAGYFSGNSKLLVNPSGQADNSGLILTWDKPITKDLWLCVDYAGSNSALGSLFWGGSWAFQPNVSLIVGYGTFNNGAKPVITTQLDINI
jgi:hypothetical protein